MNTAKSWHSFGSDKVLTLLNTDRALGLAEAKVQDLQQIHGRNEIVKEDGFYVLKSILTQLRSPLSLVLVGAGIATLILHEYLDSIVILIALTINLVIGVLQEGKAARVFDALAASQETHTIVVRDGEQIVVPAHELVPGDIVILQGGAAVPADIRLLDAQALAINESALTGEWVPVEKIATPLGRALPVQEQKNMVWMGTLVVEGTGTGVVVATGSEARFGQIAESTQDSAAVQTPLQKSIRRIAHFLMLIIVCALVCIVVLGLLRGESLAAMLLLSIAVAVAAMPEGLPAAVTVVLALGMEAILRKGGLVKNLVAAETLGSTTVILTDKTGTLTEGRMTVSGLYTAQGVAVHDTSVEGDNEELLKMAVLASDAFVEDDPEAERGVVVRGRPIEKAIVEEGLADGLSQKELFAGSCARLDFVQFESSRRYAISLNACEEKGNKIYVSGSPEHLLALSKSYLLNGKDTPLDEKTRKMFVELQSSISAEGMRFIAVAYMHTKDDVIPEEVRTPSGAPLFTFVGLIAFADAVRADVPQAIADAQSAGARVIMATGDYPETARAIALASGIETDADAPVLTGAMIEKMTDAELLESLQTHHVIARVLPEQKLRVARLLRGSGEVVAMTGDGVNDAPALVAADIGVAVGSGTEVAKAAADLVLIDNSFSVITSAIAEGRRIILNLRKIMTHLLSTGFSEIIIIAGAFSVGAPLPLLPAQILWANIVGEGFLSFPLAFEPAERDVMRRKPEKRSINAILTRQVRWFVGIISVVTGVFLFGLFLLLHFSGVPIEKVRTMMFIALSFASMSYVFSLKDLSRPVWRIALGSNFFLIGALAASLSLLFVALAFEPLQILLSLTPLSSFEIILLIVFSLLNAAVVEVGKWLLNKRLAAYAQ